jgi:phage pi2 protein 07
MQTLDVKVAIPDDYILIKKVEWEEHLSRELTGKQWGMKELEEATGRKSNWLKENVLYPYRDELDVMSGGFVRYPEKSGSPWKFGALKMSAWLEDNLERVM